MSNSLSKVTQLDIQNLKISDFKNLKVSGKTGKLCGRKFKLMHCEGDIKQETKEMAFKDLFKNIKDISEKELSKNSIPDYENLEMFTGFLNDLDEVEKMIAKEAETKENEHLYYKILTYLCRIFTNGSHHDKLVILQNKILEIIKNKPTALKHDEETKLEELLLSNGDAPLIMLKKISEPEKKDAFISKFVDQYIIEKRFIEATAILDLCENKEFGNKLFAKIDDGIKENYLTHGKSKQAEFQINPEILTSQEELDTRLEEILSKNEETSINFMLKQINDPEKKNAFISKFFEKYIIDKKFIDAAALLDHCDDPELVNRLDAKIFEVLNIS